VLSGKVTIVPKFTRAVSFITQQDLQRRGYFSVPVIQVNYYDECVSECLNEKVRDRMNK
jgi:hypothetical protein